MERAECVNLPIVNINFTDNIDYLITGFTKLGVLRELSAILLMSIALFFAQIFLSLRQPTTLVCRCATVPTTAAAH